MSADTDTDAATIEPMLEALIRQHGIERVEADLAVLLKGANWPAWQRVASLARNIANRLERAA